MTSSQLATAVKSAFAVMETFDRITPLDVALQSARDMLGDSDISTASVHEALARAERADDPMVITWRRGLNSWDRTENVGWTNTEPQTEERRAEIYTLLGLRESTRALLDDRVPLSTRHGPTVISTDYEVWYTPERAREHRFYWAHYRRLLEGKGWPHESVDDLDQATTRVVERLADPTSPTARQVKGLVVGYVQSGKTANFTGVLAKAIDAGYRLIIVLTGTLELLRAQTQRRLDMELVGKENIARGVTDDDLSADPDIDYLDDQDWYAGKFTSYGKLPSDLGSCDILRLTTRKNDYRSLQQGLPTLEFARTDGRKPMFAAENLLPSRVRLIITKKNSRRLDHIIKDLQRSSVKARITEIPTLIIDDESDQASVNTVSPTAAKKKAAGRSSAPDGIRSGRSKSGDDDRTAINSRISELLTILPRAQYVGYTATPFANVFVDPGDTADIFPRDFILSLDRPPGYMGAQDFHDLDSDIPREQRTIANSQELRHVRPVWDPEEDDTALQEALDAFVLTAAVKIHRERDGLGEGYFRHHTMLVHQSVKVADHRELAQRLARLWAGAGYAGPIGHARLRALYESDIRPVNRAAQDSASPVPDDFSDLIPSLGEAIRRIGGGESPVIVVNGDKEIEQGEADFDKRPIWKILVGGAKLSRGFTVEGLTITYYRRATNQADTLMQMGRWFGFRHNYRDLVRLYIGRQETFGRKGVVDLYDAFEALCRDEESFRNELRRYARKTREGHPAVLPSEVPPLVAQHLPWLAPTARNKMYNAVLDSQGAPWIEPTTYPAAKESADIEHNVNAWTPLLSRLGDHDEFSMAFVPRGAAASHFPARITVVPHAELLDVLGQLRWLTAGQTVNQFAPYLAFLKELPGVHIEDWALIAPQLKNGSRASLPGVPPLSLFERRRRDGREVFGALSDPKHRQAAERVSGQRDDDEDPVTTGFVGPRRGALLIYPVIEPSGPRSAGNPSRGTTLDPRRTTMAFMIAPPARLLALTDTLVRFRARDSSHPDEPVVDADRYR